MGTITVSETGNPSNSYTGEGLEWTEFIPLVELRDTTGYNIEKDKLPLEKDENDKHVFVDLLTQTNDSKKNETITTLLTALQKPVIPFLIKKGGPDEQWEDDDGYIEIEISQEKDKFVEVKGVTAKIKQKSETTFSDNILAKFGSEIEVEVDITTEESVAFYIRFLANDNEEGYSTGDYENLFCGCMKIVYETPNEWEFSKEKIEEIKVYARANCAKYSGGGDANRYHHCTDTHKHIIYMLLDSPSVLNFGKDQNHLPSANRMTPNDFVKAGESTTNGVRNKTIAATYAEPSKTFTVVDIYNKEVLTSSGQPGNTNTALKGFKESPIDYMKSNCPDNGNYVFIGAYNDDFHSFTIIVNKKDDTFEFQFIDQMVGVKSFTGNNLENSKLLDNVDRYRFNFPMKLELFQLRNKKE